METIATTVYDFNELSESAKDTARQWYCEGAYDYDWWGATYEDAERAGIKITEFDTGHSNMIHGELQLSGRDSARAILKDHDSTCETYKTAIDYLYRQPHDGTAFDEDGYLRAILQDYLYMLHDEAEYLVSEECVDEMIQANEYTFTESGKRFG